MSRPFGLLAIFVVCAFLAVWLSPERLISVGLLDKSLTSSIPIVRETALLEVRLARYLASGIALVCLLAWTALPWLARSRWYQGLLQGDARFPAAYEDHQRRFLTPTGLVATIFVLTGAIYIAVGNALFDVETLRTLNQEDGILETASALLLLVAAAVAMRAASDTGHLAFRLSHLFLALLFFAMCGEEISWGQRVFKFSTPEAVEKRNVQMEAGRK